jgi:NhaB family Na+:H+ antiporter
MSSKKTEVVYANVGDAAWGLFLKGSPSWYKMTILGFLILNPIVLATFGNFAAGWLLLAEFIFCLAMALKCYPLPAGGLLALEAVCIKMTTPHKVFEEAHHNFEVIMLLMFMVAGIFFMQDFLKWVFTKALAVIYKKRRLSVMFCFTGAFLSAFLDALTVTAVVIMVASGFFLLFSNKLWEMLNPDKIGEEGRYIQPEEMVLSSEEELQLKEADRQNLEGFRDFLRSLLMHAAVGTMLGGVCTLVGEPQNLLIGTLLKWDFATFFKKMSPITMPVFFSGIATCWAVEKWKICGHGAEMPLEVRGLIVEKAGEKLSNVMKVKIGWQAIMGVYIVIALALHLGAPGLIGLSVIVMLTAAAGSSSEHDIGPAFKEALPFTSLLVVFFAIVAVIDDNKLFKPVTDWVLSLEGKPRLLAFYIANGVLSAISDNVFVATVYMNEITAALKAGTITQEQYESFAIAINTGTNIPSIATPNGQAAFLFLLTSSVAGMIKLSYVKMLKLALPYTIVCSTVGALAVWFLL